MKLEWGRKVCCPACAKPFFDMQKTVLVCPGCGNSFNLANLFLKKNIAPVDDIGAIDDDKVAITDFSFDDESVEIESVEDSEELAVKAGIEEIKLVDDE